MVDAIRFWSVFQAYPKENWRASSCFAGVCEGFHHNFQKSFLQATTGPEPMFHIVRVEGLNTVVGDVYYLIQEYCVLYEVLKSRFDYH